MVYFPSTALKALLFASVSSNFPSGTFADRLNQRTSETTSRHRHAADSIVRSNFRHSSLRGNRRSGAYTSKKSVSVGQEVLQDFHRETAVLDGLQNFHLDKDLVKDDKGAHKIDRELTREVVNPNQGMSAASATGEMYPANMARQRAQGVTPNLAESTGKMTSDMCRFAASTAGSAAGGVAGAAAGSHVGVVGGGFGGAAVGGAAGGFAGNRYGGTVLATVTGAGVGVAAGGAAGMAAGAVGGGLVGGKGGALAGGMVAGKAWDKTGKEVVIDAVANVMPDCVLVQGSDANEEVFFNEPEVPGFSLARNIIEPENAESQLREDCDKLCPIVANGASSAAGGLVGGAIASAFAGDDGVTTTFGQMMGEKVGEFFGQQAGGNVAELAGFGEALQQGFGEALQHFPEGVFIENCSCDPELPSSSTVYPTKLSL